ncbi:MAG TPA: VWA domain-containing protein [Dyella sp.]|uniref:VWA domain-containing protein n=1 Tax=Dyella sp. TaxID=1869338 RepID=UPI002D78D197|nr:VWA domain-containing protein [Dyella sp.]HET6553694.1 VWA domain-containing protein [Dyella sp.]
MSEMWQQFHFLRPAWLFALLALPVLLALATRRSAARESLWRLVDPELLPHLLQGREHRRNVPGILLALGWILATLAMAGPTWSRMAQPLYAKRAAQVVALSLSQHMLVRDVAPSRLDRARYKVRDLFSANHDGLNALVAYAGEAFVVAPLTTDASSLNELLNALAPDTMPADGDNAAQAIERAATLVRDAKAGGGSVVLITDSANEAANTAARKARESGVRVSVLAVGTAQGGPVPLTDESFQRDSQGGLSMARRDDVALRALATAGGGRFVAMTDDHSDIDVLRDELRTDGTTEVATEQQGDEWQDRGPWLLLLLLPLAATTFRRGWVMLAALALLPAFPGPARASDWSDLWRRPDQQAAAALADGKAKEAQQLARDPALRGAAAYRAGDYASAAKSLHDLPGADAQYNLGNALAKQGDYQGALDAYGRALKANPSNADALANRQAVEDWLKKHPRQPPREKGAQDDKGKAGQGPSTTPPDNAQGQSGQQQNRAPQNGDQGQDSRKARGEGQGSGNDQQASGRNQPGKQPDESPGMKPPTPEEQAAQQAREQQAQQALQKQMDQALGKERSRQPATHELGAISADDAQSKLPADVRQALQRVPDDPGSLLRRKFDLEYRQRHGASPSEDDSQ